MENNSTFVAPEGVYSVTDEHKQTQAQSNSMNIGTAVYPSRVSSVLVRFPPPKQGSVPGFAQLLGGGSKSEPKKDRAVAPGPKDRKDGVTVSVSLVATLPTKAIHNLHPKSMPQEAQPMSCTPCSLILLLQRRKPPQDQSTIYELLHPLSSPGSIPLKVCPKLCSPSKAKLPFYSTTWRRALSG
jgi:hypothetical protein